MATQASHADEVFRNGTALTGEGITVAVIDTGIYPHEDLEGRIRDFVDLVKQKQSLMMITGMVLIALEM